MPRTVCRWVALVAACLGAGSLGATGQPDAAAPLPWPAGLPVYDHVVIVIEENKDVEQIIGDPRAPYINGTLVKEGARLTQMFGEEHNSQGNYFWLFSGSNQHVGFDDQVPPKGYPFATPNLGAALGAKGLSFKGYSEDLPEIDSQAEGADDPQGKRSYARKHNPWVSFKNVPHGDPATSANLRFADFPTDAAKFSALPTVAIVVPGLQNDMHDGHPDQSIPRGDAWLKKNLDPYYQWAKTHNSLLIVTWDESDDKRKDPVTGANATHIGLTNPFVAVTNQMTRNLQNRIATVVAGARVKPGDFPEDKGVTHVNVLRTLEAMYGLPRAGAQQQNAAAGGIRDDFLITDVFEPAAK